MTVIRKIRRKYMNIIKIEPTPNPNTMKVVLDEQKPDMKSSTHKEVSPENPDFINRVLEIDEVTSVFYALDFISVDKDLSLIHISEPTRLSLVSRMPSSA